MKALVTGANGFMGSAVVRALLEDGQEVRAFVRAGADTRNLTGLDLEIARGDVTDPDSVLRAVRGCRAVYHLAAMVYFWVPPKDLHRFYEVNVEGTKNVLAAAAACGAERVIYTSTISTIGSYGRENPTDEEHSFNLWNMSMDYERSKYSAEFEVWRAAARGLPVVAVLPAAPLGARDVKPNPIGKLILDFLQKKIPGYIEGGGNFIDVDDIARGHLLAAKSGKIGERYILGHENMTTLDFFKLLEEVSGVPAPRIKLPYHGALGLAHLLQFLANRVTHRHPLLTPSLVKVSSRHYYVSTVKAETELGFRPQSSVRQAARKAISWFLDNGNIPRNTTSGTRLRRHLDEQSVSAATV